MRGWCITCATLALLGVMTYRYVSKKNTVGRVSYAIDTYSHLPELNDRVYHYVCIQDPNEEWSYAEICRVFHTDMLSNPDVEYVLRRMVQEFIEEENYDAFTHIVLRVETYVAVIEVARSDHHRYAILTYIPKDVPTS